MQESFPLVLARELEALGILNRDTALKMAKRGLIPCYRVGLKRTGVRFNTHEVLRALMKPKTALDE